MAHSNKGLLLEGFIKSFKDSDFYLEGNWESLKDLNRKMVCLDLHIKKVTLKFHFG